MTLKTETPNIDHGTLDEYPVETLVNVFIDDQFHAVEAVRGANASIAAAVAAAMPRIGAGGRLIYVGAGTSGRLGLLDSVELYPTFSWPTDRAVALLAGGRDAIFKAVEGAEDNRDQGASDITLAEVGKNDVVIVLAASGTTPYALGAMEAARAVGALTIGIANNPDTPVVLEAECGITLDTGAEMISGSTRLKAGTAQKIALNTISSAIMVRLHKVYGNLMVDLKPTNAKLKARSIRLTMLATGCDAERASETLNACGYHVKVAIVMIKKNMSEKEAIAELDAAHGSVRAALDAARAV